MSEFKKSLQYGFVGVGVSLILFIIVSFISNDPDFYTKPGRLFYIILFFASSIGEYIRYKIKK